VSEIGRVVGRPGHALLTGFLEEEFHREKSGGPFPDFTSRCATRVRSTVSRASRGCCGW